MHAHSLRVAPRYIVLLLSATAIAWAATPVAGAQSARTTITIPVALLTTPPNARPARNTPQCVATIATAAAVRAPDDSAGSVADADSLDDGGTDPDALSAGSGMVVIDSTGRIIEPDNARQASADIAAEGCCPAPMPTVVWARWSASGYETNKSNGMRERCLDAQKPPPSTRSPK